MILMPCNQCRRADVCELRAIKREELRPHRLTVARFTCPILQDDYREGRRVSVLLQCYEWDDTVEAAFLGTVMRRKARKLLIHLDTGDSIDGKQASNKAIVKVWPKWATPLDEPDRPTCDFCHLPNGAVVSDWQCGCQPGWHWATQEWGAQYPEKDHVPEPQF